MKRRKMRKMKSSKRKRGARAVSDEDSMSLESLPSIIREPRNRGNRPPFSTGLRQRHGENMGEEEEWGGGEEGSSSLRLVRMKRSETSSTTSMKTYHERSPLGMLTSTSLPELARMECMDEMSSVVVKPPRVDRMPSLTPVSILRAR